MSLLSGYDERIVIRTHEERLDAMRASRRLPDDCAPNPACKTAGMRGTASRDVESFRRSIAERDDSTTAVPSDDMRRQLQQIAAQHSKATAMHRAGLSYSTLERILAGQRVRIRVLARVAAKLNVPAPAPRWATPSEDLIARLQQILGEEGSYKSTARRLSIGFTQLQQALAGERMTATAVAKIEEASKKPRPLGWKTGLQRLQEARTQAKARRNGALVANAARRFAQQNKAELSRPTPCPTDVIDALDAVVERIGPLQASRELGISYNCLRRLRTRVPVMPSTIALVTERLRLAREAA